MAFQYRKRSADEVEKRANQQGGDFLSLFKSEYKQYKVKKGDNFIRILPPTWEDAEHYGLDVHVHYSVGPQRETVICMNKTFDKSAPSATPCSK